MPSKPDVVYVACYPRLLGRIHRAIYMEKGAVDLIYVHGPLSTSLVPPCLLAPLPPCPLASLPPRRVGVLARWLCRYKDTGWMGMGHWLGTGSVQSQQKDFRSITVQHVAYIL